MGRKTNHRTTALPASSALKVVPSNARFHDKPGTSHPIKNTRLSAKIMSRTLKVWRHATVRSLHEWWRHAIGRRWVRCIPRRGPVWCGQAWRHCSGSCTHSESACWGGTMSQLQFQKSLKKKQWNYNWNAVYCFRMLPMENCLLLVGTAWICFVYHPRFQYFPFLSLFVFTLFTHNNDF